MESLLIMSFVCGLVTIINCTSITFWWFIGMEMISSGVQPVISLLLVISGIHAGTVQFCNLLCFGLKMVILLRVAGVQCFLLTFAIHFFLMWVEDLLCEAGWVLDVGEETQGATL